MLVCGAGSLSFVLYIIYIIVLNPNTVQVLKGWKAEMKDAFLKAEIERP